MIRDIIRKAVRSRRAAVRAVSAVSAVVLLLLPAKIDSSHGSENTLGTPGYVISRYDRIFQRVGCETGLDWHLLSAIAYRESRYETGAMSCRGAVGIMQITPSTARYLNIPYGLLEDPALNVLTAAKLLLVIDGSFNFRNASDDDRYSIILAGYNCGITNLRESRRLASAAGADCNRWDQLKHYGKVNNRQTRGFVDGVMRKWKEYRMQTASLSAE